MALPEPIIAGNLGETLAYVSIIVGVIQTLAIVAGGGMVSFRLGRSTQKVESAIAAQEKNSMQAAQAIAEIKGEIAALRGLMTEVALQKQEISQVRNELAQVRTWYDELRHGQGYVKAKFGN
jgi:ribosomal protein L29